MRIPRLASLLLLTALTGAPAIAIADASPMTPQLASVTATPQRSDADQYAAREATDTSVTKFQGGGEVVIFGASSVGILLLVLILVVLL